MRNVVTMKWLLARLYEPDMVIVDCRFQLGQPDAGRHAYEESYIPGAVHFDLERDLSSPVGEHGGRHPLPDINELVQKLGKAGIDRNVRVIAYDDQGGMMASRFWWLLRYLGHEQVYVLDQGFSAWKSAGYPVTNAAPPVRFPKTFEAQLHPEMLASVEDVRRASQEGTDVLIDSREAPRYRGEMEPIDKKAGHIPTAKNRFWKDVLGADGAWKSAEEQRERFGDLKEEESIIVYCGSGVSACPNVLALEEAGFQNVRLYVGSWSDWISYIHNPITNGDEDYRAK
ncbi:sulfurtransferase [Cohnella candidum]|uniref:Sulfurtransferase n=1 Tax=Cohnella candidum TaxID=2674991 RepID=A0A3G3K2N8_9BACL|nr:sulfurtransferase [Cohnella candidum]AYQ74756.1 sulfurtransferase [Cohnella candidum]